MEQYNIYTKVKKVFDSCETEEQYSIAMKYLDLALKKLTIEELYRDLEVYYYASFNPTKQ